MEKNKKNKYFNILKKLSIKRILFLVLLLSANTFAWFIYSTEVKSDVDVHVRAWKVKLQDEDEPIVDYVTINVDDAYPGMETFVKTITAYNEGEMSASVEYTILEASILGDTFITAEGAVENGSSSTDGLLTSDQLVNKLTTDYPFDIDFNLSNQALSSGNGQTDFSMTMSWPYESGNDALDTLYGTRAYEYINTHPGNSCITLKIKLYITQSSL